MHIIKLIFFNIFLFSLSNLSINMPNIYTINIINYRSNKMNENKKILGTCPLLVDKLPTLI